METVTVNMSKWQIPADWSWKRLDDPSVCEIIMGQSPPGNTYNETGEGLPFFQGKTDFGEYYPTVTKWCTDPRKITEPGDVLISVRAPVGPTNLTKERSIIGRGLTALRPSSKTDTKYLLFAIRNLESAIAAKGKGSTIENISKGELGETEIPFPSKNIQCRIVARIESLLAEVREMRKLQTDIKLNTNQLSSEIVSEAFREGIAHGWDWTTIGELILEQPQYGTSQKSSSDAIGLPVLRMGNIQDGELDLSKIKYVDISSSDQQRYTLKLGDILFNRTNSAELVGKSAVFYSNRPMVFASYLIRMSPDFDKANPEYIALYINSSYGRKYIASQYVRAIGQVNVNAQKLKAMPIPIPPHVDEQTKFVQRIRNAKDEIAEMRKINLADEKMIIELEATILAQAFRGEL